MDLVTSGPDILGSTRDTGVVLRELFAAAERRVLLVGFAVHQGREVFAALATRMYQRPDLAVRLCLDIRRPRATRRARKRSCADLPSVSSARSGRGRGCPKSFTILVALPDADARRASLHAKCVVVDGAKALIGSANFTEAAQLRNIEIGIATTDVSIAGAVEHHIAALIGAGHLRPLPL